MDKKVFFDRLIRILENLKERYELDSIHDALIMWFGENYLFGDPDDLKERIISDTKAEGVDAILIDKINSNLWIIQSEIVNSFKNTIKNFSENKVKSTLSGIRFLLKGNYKGEITPELENLIDEFHELDETDDYGKKVLFLTLKNRPVANKFMNNFKKDFPQIEIEFFDFNWLFNFYKDEYLIRRVVEPPEKISFKILTDFLTKDNPYKARVFTVRGEELAKIYNDYRERIFQQNIRYSLGWRSRSINKQILETAIDINRVTNFWYYNNGITMVCEKIGEPTRGRVINLYKAQIINGAQTTYVLYDAYKNGNLKEELEILIKVIETNKKDFMEDVTLYTNSQNAIRLRDLCSNDEIQIKIQKILESYKYFYERKRGELNSLYPTLDAKKEFLGKDYKIKIISNDKAAQAFLALYLNKPAESKAQKRRIFMKDIGGFYDEIFGEKDDILSEKILMSWKLLKYIEKYKKNYRGKYKKAYNLPDAERSEIYKYDFLLHSEYFILNIFSDFLKERGFDIESNKDNLLDINSKIDSNDNSIEQIYGVIESTFAEYLSEFRKQSGYYHNKFFKNEKSIALIRNFFNTKYNFIRII